MCSGLRILVQSWSMWTHSNCELWVPSCLGAALRFLRFDGAIASAEPFVMLPRGACFKATKFLPLFLSSNTHYFSITHTVITVSARACSCCVGCSPARVLWSKLSVMQLPGELTSWLSSSLCVCVEQNAPSTSLCVHSLSCTPVKQCW